VVLSHAERITPSGLQAFASVLWWTGTPKRASLGSRRRSRHVGLPRYGGWRTCSLTRTEASRLQRAGALESCRAAVPVHMPRRDTPPFCRDELLRVHGTSRWLVRPALRLGRR